MQARCRCYECHPEDGEIGAVKGDDRRTVPVKGFDMVIDDARARAARFDDIQNAQKPWSEAARGSGQRHVLHEDPITYSAPPYRLQTQRVERSVPSYR